MYMYMYMQMCIYSYIFLCVCVCVLPKSCVGEGARGFGATMVFFRVSCGAMSCPHMYALDAVRTRDRQVRESKTSESSS